MKHKNAHMLINGLLKTTDEIGWCTYKTGDGVKLYHQQKMENAINSSGVIGVSWRKNIQKKVKV